jgi:thymidylate synthase
MFLEADTLDDLLRQVFAHLIASKNRIVASRGTFNEVFGVMLELTNPRARLSRSEMKGKVFSALGEWMWYLSGATEVDFMEYYLPGRYLPESDDGKSVRSGYGTRLFNFGETNQVSNVIELLNRKKSSRRAVIQLFDRSDLEQDYKSIPCTCTLQFAVRDERLHLIVNMRSNDVYVGLPHDVFAFTMLQEVIARCIGVELGTYKHCVGSLHLYDNMINAAEQYLSEAWQSKIAMPPMPAGDPWPSIAKLRAIEAELRLQGSSGNTLDANLDDYWLDLARLLAAYMMYTKAQNVHGLRQLRQEMSSNVYNVFLDAKIDSITQPANNSVGKEPTKGNA